MRYVSLLAVFLAFVGSAQAEPILGWEVNQHFGFGTSQSFSAVDISLDVVGAEWAITALDESDIGRVFVASAATVDDYAVLDWSGLDNILLGKRPRTDFMKLQMKGTGPIPLKGWHGFALWELQDPSFPGNHFTPPALYFESLDRIECEILALEFTALTPRGTSVRSDVVWRFYGEATSAPEPSVASLIALSLLGVVPLRWR